MTNSERASYIRGLMEGLQLDPDAKETKVINAIIDLLDDMCDAIEELEDGYDSLSEEIEELDDDLSEVEDMIFGECSCGHHHSDEDMQFEVQCPSCKAVIEVDEEMLSSDPMTCPKCNCPLDFVFDEDDDDDEIEDSKTE